jgi:hypothetical protein
MTSCSRWFLGCGVTYLRYKGSSSQVLAIILLSPETIDLVRDTVDSAIMENLVRCLTFFADLAGVILY